MTRTPEAAPKAAGGSESAAPQAAHRHRPAAPQAAGRHTVRSSCGLSRPRSSCRSRMTRTPEAAPKAAGGSESAAPQAAHRHRPAAPQAAGRHTVRSSCGLSRPRSSCRSRMTRTPEAAPKAAGGSESAAPKAAHRHRPAAPQAAGRHTDCGVSFSGVILEAGGAIYCGFMMIAVCCLVRLFGQIHASSGLACVIAPGRFYGLPERPVHLDRQLESRDCWHSPGHHGSPDEGFFLAIFAGGPPRYRGRIVADVTGSPDPPVRVADVREAQSRKEDLKCNVVVGRDRIPGIDQVSPS